MPYSIQTPPPRLGATGSFRCVCPLGLPRNLRRTGGIRGWAAKDMKLEKAAERCSFLLIVLITNDLVPDGNSYLTATRCATCPTSCATSYGALSTPCREAAAAPGAEGGLGEDIALCDGNITRKKKPHILQKHLSNSFLFFLFLLEIASSPFICFLPKRSQAALFSPLCHISVIIVCT